MLSCKPFSLAIILVCSVMLNKQIHANFFDQIAGLAEPNIKVTDQQIIRQVDHVIVSPAASDQLPEQILSASEQASSFEQIASPNQDALITTAVCVNVNFCRNQKSEQTPQIFESTHLKPTAMQSQNSQPSLFK